MTDDGDDKSLTGQGKKQQTESLQHERHFFWYLLYADVVDVEKKKLSTDNCFAIEERER